MLDAREKVEDALDTLRKNTIPKTEVKEHMRMEEQQKNRIDQEKI
jgi:hypothetical protein